MRLQHWIYSLPLRFRSLLRRGVVERELDEEFRFHLERSTEAHMAGGLSATEARRAAMLAMDGLERRKEECRDMRRLNLLADFTQDVRYGARTLRKNPVFAVIAIAVLGVGIGASTAVFSFVDSILFHPPAIENPSSLVLVYTSDGSSRRSQTSYPDFLAIRDGVRTLSHIAAFTRAQLQWTTDPNSEAIWGIAASPEYFRLVGISPALGRTFGEGEARAPVVVLNDRFWRDRLNADPGVCGKTLKLAGGVYTVIGVMPDGFHGTSSNFAPEVWIPLEAWGGANPADYADVSKAWLEVAGRLRTRLQDVRSELAALQLPQPRGGSAEIRTLRAMTDLEFRITRDRTFAFIASMLSIVAGIVVLVACSNVGSLLLARAVGRRREIALRQSLGASRGRIIRQMLAEAGLVAIAGSISGAVVAWLALRAITAAYHIPSPMPAMFGAEMNVRSLVFALLVGVTAVFVFALAPALEAARTDLIGRVQRQRMRVRRGLEWLLGFQIVGGVVLTGGALLFVTAFDRAAALDPGFNPESGLAITLDPSLAGLSERESVLFFKQLTEQAAALNAISATGLGQNIPLGFRIPSTKIVAPTLGKELRSYYNIVDGDFFAALGTRILRGRPFLASDAEKATPVALVNEFLATALFPNEDAIGRRICFSAARDDCRQIVGIVQQGKYFTLAEDPAAHYWIPYSQRPQTRMTLLVRTKGQPVSVVADLRRAVATVNASVPILEVKTLREHMSIPLLEPLIPSTFLGGLSFIGLSLSLAAIVGITSYSVAQQRREIGIRMAIGAGRADALWVVMKRSMVVVSIAICVGSLLSAVSGRFVTSLLYEIDPADPRRILAVGCAILFAMLASCFWSAYPITKVDPAITLREE